MPEMWQRRSMIWDMTGTFAMSIKAKKAYGLRSKGGQQMDARELTEKYYKMSTDITELKKQMEYVLTETEKLRVLMDDLKIDIKMMEGKR